MKCGVLPRMLISLSSCAIVSTGYDTRVTSPPVKNGLIELPLRRLHRQAPDFLRERRQRDRAHFFDEALRVLGDLEDHPRLLAGRRRQVLGVLERLLPVVAESHLARDDAELILDPLELLHPDGDQLLGRVRNHLEREVGAQAVGEHRDRR